MRNKKRMKKFFLCNKSILAFLRALYRTKKPIKAWKMYQIYKNNMALYKRSNHEESFAVIKDYLYPCLYDRFGSSATVSSYFWQDLWAAKKIAEAKPLEHYDIGSRVDGLIAHLASFRGGIKCVDIRPQKSFIEGVQFIQADATNLEGIPSDSIESISALCSLEHFGLGRYGDEVDPDAFKKAANAIARVLKAGGVCIYRGSDWKTAFGV